MFSNKTYNFIILINIILYVLNLAITRKVILFLLKSNLYKTELCSQYIHTIILII